MEADSDRMPPWPRLSQHPGPTSSCDGETNWIRFAPPETEIFVRATLSRTAGTIFCTLLHPRIPFLPV
ncbi:hypothetical protein CBS63078_3877 [Aspergillus niger]|nr:hypothetical protein CBS13152_3065 [Aspergillus niger]KAI2912062.1 hypothetical protein CBS63078_3877 [Aspergillus niger]